MTSRYILQNFPIQEFVLVPSKCPFGNSRSYLNDSPVRTNPATSHHILQIQPILTSLTEALDNRIVMTTAFSTPLGTTVSSHGYAASHHLWHRVQSRSLQTQSNMAVRSWPWHILLLLYGKLLCAFGTRWRAVVAASPHSTAFQHLVFAKGMNPECKSAVSLQMMAIWALSGQPGAR
jgi:hypothetical protein